MRVIACNRFRVMRDLRSPTHRGTQPMVIQLKFMNQSQDRGNSEIVIFQKNVAAGMAEFAVAWKAIPNCGFGCHHPFTYDPDLDISIGDEYGNYSPRIAAPEGRLLAVTPTASGGGGGGRGGARAL